MTVSINGTSGLVFNDASTQNTAATGFGFKNRLINSAMMIDKRNDGASVTITNTSANTYTLDRWFAYGSAASKFSVQQNAASVTPPVGFTNYLGVTSLAATSVGSTDQYVIGQAIEGFNSSDFAWGTANASTVTLSFWVRSSLTGTFGGSIRNSAFSRSYPFNYTILAANTWEQKSITIAGDTSGTWLTNNGVGLYIYYGLGIGSSLSGTGGAWTSSSFTSVTGATSVVGTSGATFYITGVQLEKGSTATSFDYRPYGTELQLCQRYFQIIAQGADQPIATAFYVSATVLNSTIFFKTTMRATPTLSITTGTNFYSMYRQSADDFVNSLSIDTVSPNAVAAANTSEASGTSGVAGLLLTRNASSFLAVQAEL